LVVLKIDTIEGLHESSRDRFDIMLHMGAALD
jgi:hypothetical protein